MYATHGRFDIIAKVHGYTTCNSHITCIWVQLEQGIRVPLYAVKAQPTPMVSDMLEFTLKKWWFYGCFLLKVVLLQYEQLYEQLMKQKFNKTYWKKKCLLLAWCILKIANQRNTTITE